MCLLALGLQLKDVRAEVSEFSLAFTHRCKMAAASTAIT